ncbi:hypothetical protein ACET3Z_031908 [Daucus carota]
MMYVNIDLEQERVYEDVEILETWMLSITVVNEKNENDKGGGRSSDEGDFVIPAEKFSTSNTVARNSVSGIKRKLRIIVNNVDLSSRSRGRVMQKETLIMIIIPSESGMVSL